MQRNLPHEALQQRPMKDQHERAKDRQCNPGTALPSSVRRNFCLAIFAHEGGTLFPREESANNATVAALYERRRLQRSTIQRPTQKRHLTIACDGVSRDAFREKHEPDKLFDYLDGKLSTRERAELEQRLTSDQQLQRELA